MSDTTPATALTANETDEDREVYICALGDAARAVEIAERASFLPMVGGGPATIRLTPDAVLAHIGRLRVEQTRSDLMAALPDMLAEMLGAKRAALHAIPGGPGEEPDSALDAPPHPDDLVRRGDAVAAYDESEDGESPEVWAAKIPCAFPGFRVKAHEVPAAEVAPTPTAAPPGTPSDHGVPKGDGFGG